MLEACEQELQGMTSQARARTMRAAAQTSSNEPPVAAVEIRSYSRPGAQADQADAILQASDPTAGGSGSGGAHGEGGVVPLPLGLRNELAQLHGNANKLLATRLDAIITSDLTSGKEEARAERKRLIRATEMLIERVEAQAERAG